VILVDTSGWVDFFRGRGPLADRVDDLIDADEAALCGPVVNELRRGIRSTAERARVLPLLGSCRMLGQPPRLWEEAGELGFFLAREGATVKTLDLLVAAYALAHGVPLLTGDSGFARMRKAGVPLLLLA
jgi:tRNA(fMet)-specific endonuclease VapC